MDGLKLFNTKTRKKETFQSIEKGKVRMYSCGPTVYASPHIGNLRAYIFVDTLRRVLESNGYEIIHVINITDVGHLFEEGEGGRIGEDKLEYEAAKEKVSAWDLAKKYTNEFFDALDVLNIKQPHIIPRATEHIPEMIQLIETLEKRGFTYKTNDGIYFDTSKLGKYGLFRNAREWIKPGARVEMVKGKKNPTDFALWKFTPTGRRRQMEWKSPWAPRQARGKVKGFPGWHIECSAMALKYLGNAFENSNFHGERSRTIDIHTGGVDHIPVHHTNEIAQSEAATGGKFVRFWLHNEFIVVDGKKMSKSLGNVYTVKDIQEKGFHPLALRYLFLTAHYRDKLNFTWEGMEAAQNGYERLKYQILNIKNQKLKESSTDRNVQLIERYKTDYFNQLNDDLGTPKALAMMWEMLKSNIPNKDKYELLLLFDEVLGLGLSKISNFPARSAGGQFPISNEVKKLVEEREKLRKGGKWKEADQIRKKINQMGYVVEDTEEGPRIKNLKIKN